MTQPWAAPDTPAEAPPAGGPGLAPTPRRRTATAGRPEVPVPLRPLSSAERLDGALRILKLAPATVSALVLVAVVPVELLAALLVRDEDASLVRVLFGATIATLTDDGSGAGATGPLLFVVLDAVVLAWVAVGLAGLVTGWHVGRRDATGEVLRAAATRLPAIVGAVLLVKAAEAVGIVVLVVGALLPMTWFAVAAPVLGAEQAGPVTALRRSFRLTRRHLGSVFGTCALSAGVALVLRASLSTLGGFYVDAGLPGEWVTVTVLGIAVRVVVDTLVAGAAVLTYLDLRVRREGLDIELAATDRLRRAQ